MNYLIPAKGVLLMHGWTDRGIFNSEGGCYAKTIDLTNETEPDIFQTLHFGALLENVVIDEAERHVDFHDASITENTRGAYPIEFIRNAWIPCIAGQPAQPRADDVPLHQRLHGECRGDRDRSPRAAGDFLPVLRRAVPRLASHQVGRAARGQAAAVRVERLAGQPRLERRCLRRRQSFAGSCLTAYGQVNSPAPAVTVLHLGGDIEQIDVKAVSDGTAKLIRWKCPALSVGLIPLVLEAGVSPADVARSLVVLEYGVYRRIELGFTRRQFKGVDDARPAVRASGAVNRLNFTGCMGRTVWTKRPNIRSGLRGLFCPASSASCCGASCSLSSSLTILYARTHICRRA